ncbi:MAG TPA: hypothetical protein V6D10_07075 [Trichocoleus sp.]|jgi:hypothetical protein
MSNYKLSLKVDEINTAAERAFQETAFQLGREFTRVISEPRQWDGWKGSRDIVDLGQLRSSQQVVFTNPLEAVFSWNTEYASAVHEGYTLRNGKTIAGRPWTTIAAQDFDIQGFYLKAYERNLNQI